MLIEAKEARLMMMTGAVAVGAEVVETLLWEFRMSYRRILQDQGVFHKHHSRPQGLELDKAK
jgi:hypothetical protein